jgi:hypothetical protein
MASFDIVDLITNNPITCLKTNFVLNKDYSESYVINSNNFATVATGAKNNGSGGQNIQKYFLNIKPVLHFKRQFLLT